MILPEISMLNVTGETDYYFWNYKFPIKYIQLYRFKTILHLLGDVTYPNLLEVGTGSGIFLPELSRHCESLYACDVHPHFENINKLLKTYKVPQFDVSTQSIERTTYPDNFFDVVIAVSVLEFVKDLNSGINEINKTINLVSQGEIYYAPEIIETMAQRTKKRTKIILENILSKRELEILYLVCCGKSDKIIADELFLSARTVEWHRRKILGKTETRSSAELINFAIDNGMYFP